MTAVDDGLSALQRRRETRVRALTSAVLVLLLAALLVAVTAVAYLSLQARNLSEVNGQDIETVREVLASIEDHNARLIDCTNPGGACFDASQERTQDAVVGINKGTLAVIVAALSCQEDDIVGQRALARCTVKRAQAEVVR